MKKIYIIIIVLLVGIFTGNNLYQKSKNIFVKENENNYYFIQEGVYSNKNSLKEVANNLPTNITEYNKEKYYVYLGITKSKYIAEKLQEIYKDNDIDTYIKTKNISNEELKETIKQYDILLKSTNNYEEILTIEEVVLSNYEEIIK